MNCVAALTRSISWGVVEETEAQHNEDHRPPDEFLQQLQAADSSPLHGAESQDHRSPHDEDNPGRGNRMVLFKHGGPEASGGSIQNFTYQGMTRSATVRPEDIQKAE